MFKRKRLLLMCYKKILSILILASIILGINITSYASNIDVTLTVEDGATPRVLHQIKNYYQEEIKYSSKTGNVYTYSLPSSGTGYTYKVTKPGEVEQAGFFDLSSSAAASKTISFDELGTASTTEANLFTNIGAHLSKHMSIGETFRARSYRTWQIINNPVNNIMIEPEFHYEIVSGDSVSLTKSAFDSAWADIKAVKNGVSIVKAYYDAIVVNSGGTYTYYNATDENRVCYFAIIVDDGSTLDLGLDNWDSEINTVYFAGGEGEFTFTPKTSLDSVKANGVCVACTDGNYTVPIKAGCNIIEATSGAKTEVVIIKGAPISVNITHDTDVEQGSSVSVQIKGLYTPVYKMSGIYNPTAVTLCYTDPTGTTVKKKLAQYASANDITLTATLNGVGDNYLTDGYLSSTIWGSTWGLHRGITDAGVDPNFNAQSLSGKFGQLPNLNIASLDDDNNYVLHGSTPTVYAPNKNIWVAKFQSGRLCSLNCISSQKEESITDFDKAFIWDENNAPIFNSIIK